VFTRFNMYFFIAYLILVPNTIAEINEREYKFLVKTAIIVLCIGYYYLVTLTANDLTPYYMNIKLFS
jgi:hypothetical protein